MAAVLGHRRQMPFPCLTVIDLLAAGSVCDIYQISGDIVFKCHTQFEDGDVEERERNNLIQRESHIYSVLSKRPHQNIVDCILSVPEGIFLRRQPTTMENRIAQLEGFPANEETQLWWIKELVCAAAWIEELGFVHGDLQPSNILLDSSDHLQLCDFESTVLPGQQLPVATTPFCKLLKGFKHPTAGPGTEQFAIASCIFLIRTGKVPFHEVDDPEKVQKLMRGEIPSTATDASFGDIEIKCWQAYYQSVDQLKTVALSTVDAQLDALCTDGSHQAQLESFRTTRKKDERPLQALAVECEVFLRNARGGGRAPMAAEKQETARN